MSELQRARSLACAIIIAVVLFSSSALLRVVTDKYGPRYFMNQVYAAGLSGSECFFWTAVEVQNLDRTWIHLARSGQHVVCDFGCYPDASANACAMMLEKNCQYH